MAMDKAQRAKYEGVYTLDGATHYHEPPKPLIKGVLMQGEYTLLSGQPKVGKSTCGAHVAYSVATGVPFFGREVLKTGRVVYIALERAHQTESRINRLMSLYGRGAGNITLVVPADNPRLQYLFLNNSERDDASLLIEELESHGIYDVALFVVDSLENSIDGSDSQQSDAGPWCNGLKRLIDHFSASALVLHHDTKGSADDTSSKTAYSGSRVFLARAGVWVRAMSRGDKCVLLKTQVGNYAESFEQHVTINDDGLYDELTPDEAKRYTQFDLVRDVVLSLIAEGITIIDAPDLLDRCQQHPSCKWPDFDQARMSKQITTLEANEGIIQRQRKGSGGRGQSYLLGDSSMVLVS